MKPSIPALITALLLVTSSAIPSKVLGQEDIVGKTRILSVVGIGTSQRLELYLFQRNSTNLAPPSDRVFFNYNHFVNVVNPSGVLPDGGTCKQTAQATVMLNPGLNIINVELGDENESLLINGKTVADLPSCFSNVTKRVVVELGVTNSASMTSDIPVVPNSAPLGFSNVRIVGFTVVNSDESTAASTTDIGMVLVMERSFDVGN